MRHSGVLHFQLGLFHSNGGTFMKRSSLLLAGMICPVLISSVAFADLLCIKSSYSGGSKVAMKTKTVTTSKCPKGYYKIVNTSTFVGPQGPQGAQGPQGTDGQVAFYGDGSAGAKTISADAALGAGTEDDPNLQFTDFVVDAGKTLTLHSGTVIRCSGNFTNNGTIVVDQGAEGGLGSFSSLGGGLFSPYSYRNGPAHPGVALSAAGNGPQALASAFAHGGAPGIGLSGFQARQIVRVGLAGGGGGGSSGYKLPGFAFVGSNSGGDGGGSFTVLAKGTITNNGIIEANGASNNGGGGAGGIVVLGAKTTVTLTSSSHIEAKGATGGNAGNDAGPSGGGGGGIVHFIAPAVNASAGSSIDVSGGAAGTTSAGVITAITRYGGGGGGACGGSGGAGGDVAAGAGADTGDASAGGAGYSLTTQADPTALL